MGEGSAATWTRFEVTIQKNNEEKIVPTRIVYQSGGQEGVRLIHESEQARFSTPVKSKSMFLPAMIQISSYFNSPMGLSELGRSSSLEHGKAEVSRNCDRFRVVPAHWLRLEGKKTDKIVSVLFCDKGRKTYQKIGLVTLKRLP